MNDIENIKYKVCDLNAGLCESFKEAIDCEATQDRVKCLKVALERAEDTYKHLKGLRNVPSDIIDYESSRLRVEYNLFMLYVLNAQIYDAKKCLDKLKFNPTIKKLDSYKRRKLIIVCLHLAITYISSNKNDVNALDNGIECFEFIMDYFFDTFHSTDDNFLKYYAQLISIFVYILNNDKEKTKKFIAYANRIVLYKEADGKLDAGFAKLYSDLALNFAKIDYDVAKGLLDKALEVLQLLNSKANDVVLGIIYNNYTALFNRYKKFKEAVECKAYSVDLIKENLERKKDNKFLKFQLSDSCFNMGYAYTKLGELENMDENNERAREHFWMSYAEAKDIFYVANQYESLEANATIDSCGDNEKLLNSLEYFNQALKIYNKSIDNKTNKETDEVNRRLNNKIRAIQAKLNETNLQDVVNNKKLERKKLEEEEDGGTIASDYDYDLYENPKNVIKVRNSNTNLANIENKENEVPAEEQIYTKVTVNPDRSRPVEEESETAGTSTSRSSTSAKTTTTITTTTTSGTVTGTETDATTNTSGTTTDATTNSDTTTTTPPSSSDKPKSEKKSKDEADFDRAHYESVVQQLVRQNLVKKRTDVAILYPDFNKGRIPKSIPSEGGSGICTIL